MLLQLQPCLHNSCVSFSSFPPILPCKFSIYTLQKFCYFRRLPISCSISKVHSYETLDCEQRPTKRWNAVYMRIYTMKNPEMGSAAVLNQFDNEGDGLTKTELFIIVKKLRKYHRYERALEVYEWMSSKRERFRISASDEAIIVDLIAKVHGVLRAENYFLSLTDELKDNRTYGALLNVYVQVKLKEKAESLLEQMRSKGYTLNSLTYNVMMTLYMKLKEYDKVDSMALEMIDRGIQLDRCSYNIWLCSSGSQGLAEKLEEVLGRMNQDTFISPDWNTFSTVASIYIKLDQFEKAEEYIRRVEDKITGQGRRPYHCLLSLYGSIGKKEEVYRIWQTYKSVYPRIPNLGYHAIICSLVRMDDIESAEKIYKEWLSVKSSYNPIIGNLLLGSYVQNGDMDKALSFFKHMIEVVGKPNSTSWEFCAQGHLAERRISDALSCWTEAFKRYNSRSWKPKPRNVSAFFKACEEANDSASKEVFLDLLNQSGFLKDQSYVYSIGLTHDETSNGIDIPNRDHKDTSDDGYEILLNQLESSL